MVRAGEQGGTRPPFPDVFGLMLSPERQGGASTAGSSSQKPRGVTPPSRKREVGLLHEDSAATAGSVSPSRSAAEASAEGGERQSKSPRSLSPSALRMMDGQEGIASVFGATGPGMENELAERVDERIAERVDDEVFAGRVAERLGAEQDEPPSDSLPPVQGGIHPISKRTRV